MQLIMYGIGTVQQVISLIRRPTEAELAVKFTFQDGALNEYTVYSNNACAKNGIGYLG